MTTVDKSSAPTIDEPLHARRVRQVELLISTLLRVGVIFSLAVVVLGTIFTFAQQPDLLHSHDTSTQITQSAAEFPHSVGQVIDGVRHASGKAIVTAGLLLLIATPVMRVAISIFGFVYEHDPKYVVITSIVLAILLLSFVLGKASG